MFDLPGRDPDPKGNLFGLPGGGPDLEGNLFGEPDLEGNLFGEPDLGGNLFGEPDLGGNLFGEPDLGGNLFGEPDLGGNLFGEVPNCGCFPGGGAVGGDPVCSFPIDRMHEEVHKQNNNGMDERINELRALALNIAIVLLKSNNVADKAATHAKI